MIGADAGCRPAPPPAAGPARPAPLAAAAGHATTLRPIGGLNGPTGPIFAERALPVGFVGPRRVPPPVVPVPLGNEAWMESIGIVSAVEPDGWPSHRIGAIEFVPTPAQQRSPRGLLDRMRTPGAAGHSSPPISK